MTQIVCLITSMGSRKPSDAWRRKIEENELSRVAHQSCNWTQEACARALSDSLFNKHGTGHDSSYSSCLCSWSVKKTWLDVGHLTTCQAHCMTTPPGGADQNNEGWSMPLQQRAFNASCTSQPSSESLTSPGTPSQHLFDVMPIPEQLPKHILVSDSPATSGGLVVLERRKPRKEKVPNPSLCARPPTFLTEGWRWPEGHILALWAYLVLECKGGFRPGFPLLLHKRTLALAATCVHSLLEPAKAFAARARSEAWAKTLCLPKDRTAESLHLQFSMVSEASGLASKRTNQDILQKFPRKSRKPKMFSCDFLV